MSELEQAINTWLQAIEAWGKAANELIKDLK